MISLLDTTLGMAVRMSTPYLFAALGGMLSQHAGVYNFALEGMMLGGAFFGYLFAWLTGNLFIGILGAIICGIAFGFLFSFIIMRFGVSQMVLGLGFNTLFLGITGFGQRLLNLDPNLELRLTKLIDNVFKGSISEIPIIGSMIFNQNVLSYLIVALFVFYAWFIKNTRRGLALRSVGENPSAAESAGINVFRYRYTAIIISCILPALGGAYLTLSQVNRFSEGMTDGRGWIAIAALVLGRLKPSGVFMGCLLFGLTSAVSNQIQVLNIGVPYQIALMLPYILAILALITTRNQKAFGPAALGKPYLRNK